MNIVIGITHNGEQLRFERWAYDSWVRGMLADPLLIAQLCRCVRFETEC